MGVEQRLTRDVLEHRARVLRQASLPAHDTLDALDRNAHLHFRTRGTDLLVPLERVKEVIAAPSITAIPCVPAWVAGVVNLRGVIVDVIELGRLLGLDERTDPVGGVRRVLLCEALDAAFGLAVDEVVGIVPVVPGSVEETPATFPDPIRRFVDGVVRFDPAGPRIAPVLGVSRLLSDPALRTLRGVIDGVEAVR